MESQKPKYKFKNYVAFLSQIDEFESPKIELEQYCTPADITAGLFEIIEVQDDNIRGKVVGDFCCGTAMYSIAASYFEPSKIVALEFDESAMEIAKANLDHYELTDDVDLKQMDITQEFAADNETEYNEFFDTIIMNPPFGTKKNQGIDMQLLSCCVRGLKKGGTLYSLHKESTSKFIVKYVQENHKDCSVELLSKIQFDLPNTYKFHKKKNAVTEVVLVKVCKSS